MDEPFFALPLPAQTPILPRSPRRRWRPSSAWFYAYTLLDVPSWCAHASVLPKISTKASLRFVRAAQETFPFQFLQSDNGPEFSRSFTERVHLWHRHSRVRRPNDNAHLERFNRTIQEECFARVPETLAAYKRVLPESPLLQYRASAHDSTCRRRCKCCQAIEG